jgi:hypothetical protein
MHNNMSTIDRVARTGLGVAALVIAIVIGPTSVGGLVLLVVTALMGVTASVGFCPLYALLRFDSHGRRALHG